MTADEESTEILEHPFTPVVPPTVDELDPLQEVTGLSIPFCNATIAKDLFAPPSFHASERLESTNDFAVRFGGSNDMMTLLQGTSDEQYDYLVGLVASSIVLAIGLVIWMILILIMKFASYRLTGFLCGRFIRPPAPQKTMKDDDDDEEEEDGENPEGKEETGDPENTIVFSKTADSTVEESTEKIKDEPYSAGFTDNNKPTEEEASNNGNLNGEGLAEAAPDSNDNLDQDVVVEQVPSTEPLVVVNDETEQETSYQVEFEKWQEQCRRQEKRLFRTRIVLVISCLSIMICAILFCVKGNEYLNGTFTSVYDGLRHLQRLCDGGAKVIDNFLARETLVSNSTREALLEINGICPKVRRQLCQQLEPVVDNCDLSGIPLLGDTFEKVFTVVYLSKAYLFAELEKLRVDLQQMSDDLDEFLSGSVDLEWAFWVSFSFAIALSVCCLTIIWGIYLAHRGKLSRFQKWFRHRVMFPIFCIFVLIAFIFAEAFIIAAVGASDFCINSPDGKVTYMLDQMESELGVVHGFAKYYVNQCQNDLAPVTVDAQSGILVSILNLVKAFSDKVNSLDTTQWEEACGKDAIALSVFSDLLERVTCLLTLSVEDLNRFFWCRQWSPIYNSFMHNAVCFNAQNGLAWIASTMFCIVIFAFIILLLRAGAFDIEEEEDYLRDMRSCRVCCYRCVTCVYCQQCCGKKSAAAMEDDDDDDGDDFEKPEQYPVAEQEVKGEDEAAATSTEEAEQIPKDATAEADTPAQ